MMRKNILQTGKWLVFFLTVFAFVSQLCAQTTQLQINGLKQFYSSPYLLDFTFSVRDQNNHAVILNPSQFTVACKEDGQAISASETGYRLLSGDNKQLKGFVVLDYTMSMIDPDINGDSDGDYISDSVEAMEAGAKGIIAAMHADAQVGLFEFHRADAGFPPQKIASLTVDKSYLTNQINQTYANVMWTSGSTRCWDALYLALSEFSDSNPTDDQRFLVFLSDGKDESSTHNVNEVISLAKSKGAKIYCIGYGKELTASSLQNITSQTGGQYYAAGSVAEMTQRFEQIITDLGGQYILRWATLKRSTGFSPSFDLSYSGVKVTGSASTYYPSSYQGDELQGHLYFDTSLSQNKVATLVLRVAYVPRGITRIRLNFATALPFTLEQIPYGEGGVCPTNWTFTVKQEAGVGYFELSSPAPANPFSALPFATLGKLVKFQFQGVTNLPACFYDLGVDNSFYPTPGGPSFVVDNASSVLSALTTLPHGTPITWLNQYGYTAGLVQAELSDPDGDGVPNWMEYQAGTIPTNKQSAFLIRNAVVNTTGCQITFNTESNRIYRVDYADSLNAWKTLQAQILGNGQPITISDAAIGTKRFYQVVITGVTNQTPASPSGMVWIAPGTFTMGSPSTEKDRGSDEGPQTVVTISKAFWMGKYEVTQKEYQAIMGSNPSYFKGDNLPVEQVTWYDATNYCGKLTQQERAAGRLPAGYIYRLPTEAEWEYACRGGTTTRYSYGDDLNYTGLGSYAWYDSNSGSQTHPVGQKQANPWGLYDMYGNVFEWCMDWYGTYSGGSVTDPKGSSSGSYRVRRGGGWFYSGGGFCRSAGRSYYTPASGTYVIGFRPVLAPGQ